LFCWPYIAPKGISNVFESVLVPVLLGQGVHVDPDRCPSEVFLIRVETLCPVVKIKLGWVKDVGAFILNFCLVVQVMEEDGEEAFWSQLQIIVSFGFPFVLYPSSQRFLSGPYANELANEGMISHFLSSGIYSFCWENQSGSYCRFGYASFCISRSFGLCWCWFLSERDFFRLYLHCFHNDSQRGNNLWGFSLEGRIHLPSQWPCHEGSLGSRERYRKGQGLGFTSSCRVASPFKAHLTHESISI